MITSPCNNSVFRWVYNMSDVENSILIVYNVFLIPFSLIANSLVIYTVRKTKQVRQGVNSMFIFLSISDCLIAAICEIPNMVLLTAYRNQRNCYLELWIQYSSSFLCVLSGMIILSISVDRYIQTQKAIKMKFDRSKRRSIFLMLFSLLVAFVVLALDIQGTFITDYTWINMAIQLTELLVVVAVCLLYILTYYSVSKNRKKHNLILNMQSVPEKRKHNVPYVRAMIATTIMILCSLLICYFPLLILGIITVFKSTQKSMTTRTFWNYLSFHLGFTSSFLSAAIFLYRNKQCRAYIAFLIFRKHKVRRKHSMTNTHVLQSLRKVVGGVRPSSGGPIRVMAI